jgi:hypothetical protein
VLGTAGSGATGGSGAFFSCLSSFASGLAAFGSRLRVIWIPLSSILMSTLPYFSFNSFSFAARASFCSFVSFFFTFGDESSEWIVNLSENGGISERIAMPISSSSDNRKNFFHVMVTSHSA